MFSKIPSFFSMPNVSASADNATPTFAGMPLVNPLLNDAQQNIESLDERIQQLESVAQWLNMNLQLVNSTVQQLQVQKQTLQALAQWQALSKDALGELAKMNPFAAAQGATEEAAAEAVADTKPEPKKTTAKQAKAAAPEADELNAEPDSGSEKESSTEALPAAFEKMAQSWWDGLQNQFAQLAQPLVDAAKTTVAEVAEHGLSSTSATAARTSRAKKAPAVVSKTPRKTTSTKAARTKS